jgi:hypothetical protein
MKSRPILFSAPMVRTILSGVKCQTRRVVKFKNHHTIEQRNDGQDWPWMYDSERDADWWMPCPYGQPGDQLWVRESWKWCCSQLTNARYTHHTIQYAADQQRQTVEATDSAQYMPMQPPQKEGEKLGQYLLRMDRWWDRYRPSIHMPRWASRITLEVTGVRVERLNDISRGDAMAEGCPFPNMSQGDDPRQWYTDLWTQINGAGSWRLNP